jgi:dipeptidyl aminopeptidase/acylaminoacyl peptidase
MKNSILFLLFLSIIHITNAQNGTEPVLLTDMLKIKTVSNIHTTKDGSKAAFTVMSIEQDENNRSDYRYLTQIHITSTTQNSSPVQLTTAKEGASQPAWSPDGKQLAFVRIADGRPQIFIISMSGGEPVQITKHQYGASNPKWSPDGKQLVFTSSISLQDYLKDSILHRSMMPAWPVEKPGLSNADIFRAHHAKPDPNGNMAEIRTYLQKNEVDRKAIVLNRLNFQNETNLSSEVNFNQFFITGTAPGAQPQSLTTGFYQFNNAEFLPNGRQVLITADIDSLENPDRSLESQVYLVDINGRNMKLLLGDSGKIYNSVTVSPSGKWIAFLQGNTSFVSIPELAIMPLGGSEKDIISIPYDRNKTNLKWSLDERFLYFTSQSNGGNILNRLNIATRKIESLTTSEEGITSYDLAGNNILFSKTQVSNPSELYIADAAFKSQKQLSNFNDWVKTKKLSFPGKHVFTNDKGMQVEYWVMKPTNFQSGNTYPLLLEIHGGPSAMWGPGEASMWHEYQYFCSKGYGVVYSNPRGSGGYGSDFLRGNINDWGAGPASDVLTALDKTVAEGWADKNKLMITGGSYAGYLTAWIISHDKRFAAACAQRGVYDLLTFFGEGNAWRLVPNYFGGYPWEPAVKEVLMRESPINYVQNIETPFIIFHGGNDRRTGFIQAEMMFRSLKVLNRPVEFVVHPGASHEITRTGDNRQRMDQMLRTYEFFERWISK